MEIRSEKSSAAAAVRRLFDALRDKFATAYPSEDFWPLVQLEFRRKHFTKNPTRRDCAWFEPETLKIVLLRRCLGRESAATISGILAHEFGHCVDCLQGDLSKAGAERRADIHAAGAGCPVFYDANDMQNSLKGAGVRPAHLHR